MQDYVENISVKYFITVIKDLMVTQGNKYACYFWSCEFILMKTKELSSISRAGVQKNLLKSLKMAKCIYDYISYCVPINAVQNVSYIIGVRP